MIDIDFDRFKTPIYSGINDRIESATQNKASNASDLIDKVNGLAEYTKRIYNDVYEQINNIPIASNLLPDWTVVTEDCFAEVNNSYLVLPQVESIFVRLPFNGINGKFIKLVKLDSSTTVEITKTSAHMINGNDNWSSVYLTGTKKVVYIFATKPREDLVDWITLDDSAFTFNSSVS